MLARIQRNWVSFMAALNVKSYNLLQTLQKLGVSFKKKLSLATMLYSGYIFFFTEKKGMFAKTYTQIFIAALFVKTPNRKQPRSPSADEWLKKQKYIHTMKQ